MTNYIIGYLLGFMAFMALCAIRNVDAEIRLIYLLGVFWPISLIIMVITKICWIIKWDFGFDYNKKIFGFRRPNDNWPGFAITIFHGEFQFWKLRK